MDDRQLRRSYDALLAQRVSLDRTACPGREELENLVDRRSAEETRLATLDHVMSCPECREDFERIREQRT